MQAIVELLDIMKTLRDPERGCPWDRQQTIQSIPAYTLEEVYELVEAVESDDMDGLCDELGDLLFHVVYYAEMAAELKFFDFETVVRSVNEKLKRRHPHVFAGTVFLSEEEQTRTWEKIKQEERQGGNNDCRDGYLTGISQTLPAMLRAYKLQKKAAMVGFDWTDVQSVVAKIEEELAELKHEILVGNEPAKQSDEVGDLLFSVINCARHLHVDPEQALRGTNRKFERRFAYMEERLNKQDKSLADAQITEMECMWEEAKRRD